ncbi:uncharacterized protein LOC117429585 isoform X2 [Acipenser ruthenus]|uniref:uncharacterized protein LOC117429585 isoform X2 n=1 Tax=Acipenser ruthenus TaxID=7906 RepID=UPI002741EAC2|nr:uncharacterized protein LOC117429585 isoform X2 [Acipenser ruthenus]
MTGIGTPVPRLLFLLLISLLPVSSKEPCVPLVIAKRSFTSIPVGGALSLNCSVLHCGPGSWSGEWGRSDVGNFNPLNLSDDRVQVTVIPERETQTTLQLTIQNMMYNDSGGYQCRVIGTESNTSNMGHMTNVTVTDLHCTTKTPPCLPPDSPGRRLHVRLLVCFSPVLSLGVGCLLCWSCRATKCKASAQTTDSEEPATELVYTTVILRDPSHHPAKAPPPSQSEYSTIHFPHRGGGRERASNS